ncbi:MAG TPA: hypothetical protein PLJ84_02035 [Bacteroidales bacterium]|nr:hypothetical protein [Bacteroidales bacterium]HPT01348.1 hypothetical protein [Bacteroidales bacterium]
MTYKDDIKQKFENIDGHLWWPDTNKLSQLNGNADDFFDRTFPEGKIAALFIYHQLMIEQMKMLIKYINYYIQVSLYPTVIQVNNFENESQFGSINEYFKYTIEFKGKAQILKQAQILNRLRNNYGHSMTDKWLEDACDKELSNLKTDYYIFFKSWSNGINEIRKLVEKVKQSKDIKRLIELT